jgi:hypothetical protein
MGPWQWCSTSQRGQCFSGLPCQATSVALNSHWPRGQCLLVAPAGFTGTGGVFFLRHQRAGPPGAVVACYPPHAVLAQPVAALDLYFVAKPKHLTGSIHEASTLILKQAAHIRVQLHVLGYLHNHVAPSHGPWASPVRSIGLTVMSVGALHRLNAVHSRHVRWHRTTS